MQAQQHTEDMEADSAGLIAARHLDSQLDGHAELLAASADTTGRHPDPADVASTSLHESGVTGLKAIPAETACSPDHLHATPAPACTTPQDAFCRARPEPDEELECVVCWAAAPGLVFQPCGHLCACAGCAQAFLGPSAQPCPMCRTAVTSGIAIL